MSRSRAAAKAAGSRFERLIADYLAAHVSDVVDRRVKTGAGDKGDIGGLRVHGQRVVVECKDVARTDLAGWVTEAEAERVNDGALVGVVAHKRRGKGGAGEQYVTLTVDGLVALLTGVRP